MAAIEDVMIDWKAFKLNNREAYEKINQLILDYQKLTKK